MKTDLALGISTSSFSTKKVSRQPKAKPLSDHAVDKLRPDGKSRQVRIRVAPDERDTFDQAAKMSGLTLSAWVRFAARQEADRRFRDAGKETPWSGK